MVNGLRHLRNGSVSNQRSPPTAKLGMLFTG